MLATLILLTQSKVEWRLDETLHPKNDTGSIFGRSVGISSKFSNRVAVGASWENSTTRIEAGGIYIYDYDSVSGRYSKTYHHTFAKDIPNIVQFSNTGSTIAINSEGTRVVAGAPKSSVFGAENGKNDDPTWLNEVGAAVVFDLKEDKWVQTGYVIPSILRKEQGFGRSLAISTDGKRIASAYYNKPKVVQYENDQGIVFVSYEIEEGVWAQCFSISPPAEWAGRKLKFGSDLHFVDDSTLLIAVQLFDYQNPENMKQGTLIYKRKDTNHWELDQEIKPASVTGGKSLTSYGKYVSMPIDTQSILGVDASFDKSSGQGDSSGAFYLLERKSGVWDTNPQQTIPFEDNIEMNGLFFCDSNIFASFSDDGTSGPNRTHLFIYTRNDEGKFVKLFDIAPPANSPQDLVYGSAISWRNDCKVLVIGAMNKKPYESHDPDVAFNKSNVYIYRFYDDDDSNTGGHTGLIVTISIVSAVIVVGVIIGVVLHLRNRKMNSNYESRLI